MKCDIEPTEEYRDTAVHVNSTRPRGSRAFRFGHRELSANHRRVERVRKMVIFVC